MNLPEPNTNISHDISFVLQDGSNLNANQARAKQQLLEHINNGVDLIMVTCTQADHQAPFLQYCFNGQDDQIRTIILDSISFARDAVSQSGYSHELSMVSAVAYESIHLDTHFAIVISNADQLPIQILSELIKLALGINSSKNNINFIFSGSPELLTLVQHAPNANKLSSIHFSLDELNDEDIENYIDQQQVDCVESKKIKFNRFALKKTAAHADGSLHKASILLEWCRAYALHTTNYKVTVSFIDEILNNSCCAPLLSEYPPVEFNFDPSTAISEKSDPREERLEFNTQNIENKNHDGHASRTVIIDDVKLCDDSHKAKKKNTVYEKAMATKSGETQPEEIHPDETQDIFDEEILEVSLSSDSIVNHPVIKPSTDKLSSQPHAELEYQDTYRVEAVKEINTPTGSSIDESASLDETDNLPQDESLPSAQSSKKKTNPAFVWTFFVLLLVIGAYYYITQTLISNGDVPSFFSQSGITAPSQVPATPPAINKLPAAAVKPKTDVAQNIQYSHYQAVTRLLKLAETQIDQKKLSTPPSDNALDTYNEVLKLDPHNQAALEGIQLIKERYQTWAKLDIKEGNSRRAIYFLQRAMEIAPDEEAANLLSSLQ